MLENILIGLISTSISNLEPISQSSVASAMVTKYTRYARSTCSSITIFNSVSGLPVLKFPVRKRVLELTVQLEKNNTRRKRKYHWKAIDQNSLKFTWAYRIIGL